MSRSTAHTRRSLLPLLAAMAAGLSMTVHAQSLTELHEAARSYDASYQSAKSQYEASVAKGDQAKSLVLPTVLLTLGAERSSQEVPTPQRSYGNQNATLTASQPLYSPGNWASFEQGKKAVQAAEAALRAAEQTLMINISQAYFDVLASSDSLAFVKSQKVAVAEQLASAKRNFEVGTSTITDTREAQARFDLVTAQELAAENDLQVKSIALNQLTGLSNAKPKPVSTPIALATLTPADVNEWVSQSLDKHPTIKQLQTALEVAKLETNKAQAGHKPTVDLKASYRSVNNNGVASGSNPNADTVSNTASLGVTLTLPLFTGFSTQNKIRETLALEDKARTDLEAATRTIAQTTRTAYFGVLSGLGQVKALEAAEASSQSALDANKLGYQVGVRINIDVLNSQSQLFDTKAKLAKARYDVLLGGLKLRQANGTLSVADLQEVTSQLVK
ncbi:TolC family outer membrane protein [Rhodoferax aquaticus]|uniref:Channel protein TolC n=1 Tax=Rhodoferax aquaticus TaxID=2527691 RepID=A0A515EMK7_9BURK|nr:TolC family outer membrane protein [Rhodoferax aquaticus]QDL53883.1 channel protein TolC [Rhodoferax aquaticus]